jgi:FtsP/CotA-like multicopper oxidase with cupredoxin domain
MIAGQPTTSITSLVLTAAASRVDGQQVFALNGSARGPELRVNQGVRVEVTLMSHLPESTTLHWHGVMVPTAEDGVAPASQEIL